MTQTLTNRYNQCLYNEHPLVQQLHGLPAGSPDANPIWWNKQLTGFGKFLCKHVQRSRPTTLGVFPSFDTNHLSRMVPVVKIPRRFPHEMMHQKNHKCGAIPRWCEIAPGESWRKRKKTYIWTKYPVILNEKISTSIRVTTNQCLFPGSLNRWKEAYNLPEGKDYKW